MKPIHALPCCLMLGLASCGSLYDPVDAAQYAWDQRHPPAEARWNGAGLWRRVADSPPTFIPRDYPTSAPRTARCGEWIEDARDGKRFYVPRGGAGGFSEQVLQRDAMKHSRARKPVPKEAFDGWRGA